MTHESQGGDASRANAAVRSEGAGAEARFIRGSVLSALVAVCVTDSAALAQKANEAIVLEPIKVTGEKTVRTVKTTSSSVSVLTDEDLRERPGTATLEEALGQLPNVLSTGTGNFAPTIRGSDTTGPAQGATAFIAGTRPRTTVQVDGRPLTYNEFIFGQTELWDVERVQVFRGPQTTLQGRNSIAGAIVIDTKDPTFEYEGGARAIFGNYGTRQFSGVVSGPIVNDQLAFRVAVDQRDHESFVEVARPPVGVEDPNEEDATNVRGKLLFVPQALPQFSAKLTYNHADNRQPQTELVNEPFEERELTATAPGQFPLFATDVDSGILDLGYFVTPWLELRNATTYSDVRVNRLADPGQGVAEILADEFTNETILEYAAPEDGLQAILGAYYFNATTDESIDIGGGGSFDDETHTAAIFGEGTMTFFDKLDFTLGGRYEHEERERAGTLGDFVIDLDETFEAFLPKVGVAYRPNDRFTYGATVQRGFNGGGAGIAFAPPFPSFTFDEEYVWNYETFVRSSWLNNRFTIDGNVFYADFEDQQREDVLSGDAAVIRNADATHSYGAEITANWLPRKDLDVFGSLGLLETEIDEFGESEDLEGNEFARAPNVTAALGATYRFARGLSVGVDGQYVGSYFSEDDNAPVGEVDSFVLFNARASYDFGKRYRLFAFGTNLFDKDHELLINPASGGFPTTAQLVDPREFGVGLEVNF